MVRDKKELVSKRQDRSWCLRKKIPLSRSKTEREDREVKKRKKKKDQVKNDKRN